MVTYRRFLSVLFTLIGLLVADTGRIRQSFSLFFRIFALFLYSSPLTHEVHCIGFYRSLDDIVCYVRALWTTRYGGIPKAIE